MEKIIVEHGDHFCEEGFTSHATFLPDDYYAMVLDNAVITCVDICIVNEHCEMLLGKRVGYPHPNWWIIGGRMRPGESFHKAASRNVKRELDLHIEMDRFERLWEYSTSWAKRAQAPEDNGCHTVSITMLLRILPEEATQIQHNEEYEDMKWVKLKEMANDILLHPALNTLAKKAIIREEQRRLLT